MRGRGAVRGRKIPYRQVPRIYTKPVFDFYFCDPVVDRASDAPDDAEFTQALLKRNGDLTPTSQEQTAIMSLVTKISEIADNLIVAPATFSGCQLEEACLVGSYKKGTMIRGHNAADIVIILKTLPTKEAVEQLGTKVHADLTASGMTGVKFETNEHGFVITSDDATVNCLVTTISQNIRSLDRDLHLDVKVVQAHLAAVRHSRWFEENGRYSSVKILARLLKDLAMRYEGFSMLKPWMIDILSHYTTMGTRNNQPLPINQAFRRCLQLLSAGFFLPLSSSINDPCENAPVKIHSQLSLEEQDLLCMTAQTLLRILSHGGYKEILGLEGDSLLSGPKIVNGVKIAVPERVFKRISPTSTEDAHDEDMENESPAELESLKSRLFI